LDWEKGGERVRGASGCFTAKAGERGKRKERENKERASLTAAVKL
jgi:hypothetical protein